MNINLTAALRCGVASNEIVKSNTTAVGWLVNGLQGGGGMQILRGGLTSRTPAEATPFSPYALLLSNFC